jgi:hypothetical protein
VVGVNQRSPKRLAVVKLLPAVLPTLGTIFQLIRQKNLLRLQKKNVCASANI